MQIAGQTACLVLSISCSGPLSSLSIWAARPFCFRLCTCTVGVPVKAWLLTSLSFPLDQLKMGTSTSGPVLYFFRRFYTSPPRGCSTRATAKLAQDTIPVCRSKHALCVVKNLVHFRWESHKCNQKKSLVFSAEAKTFSAKLLLAPLNWSTLMLEAKRKTKHARFNVVMLAASLFFIFSADICNVTEI